MRPSLSADAEAGRGESATVWPTGGVEGSCSTVNPAVEGLCCAKDRIGTPRRSNKEMRCTTFIQFTSFKSAVERESLFAPVLTCSGLPDALVTGTSRKILL